MAEEAFGASFPHGYTLMETEAKALRCRLYAIINSIDGQYPSLLAPKIGELSDIAVNGVAAVMQLEIYGKVKTNHFTSDHVASVL